MKMIKHQNRFMMTIRDIGKRFINEPRIRYTLARGEWIRNFEQHGATFVTTHIGEITRHQQQPNYFVTMTTDSNAWQEEPSLHHSLQLSSSTGSKGLMGSGGSVAPFLLVNNGKLAEIICCSKPSEDKIFAVRGYVEGENTWTTETADEWIDIAKQQCGPKHFQTVNNILFMRYADNRVLEKIKNQGSSPINDDTFQINALIRGIG